MIGNVGYPYSEGDLLVDRNTYFYSAFHGAAFLDAWQTQRDAVTSGAPRAARIRAPAGTASAAMIKEIRASLEAGDDGALSRLDRLVQRFEVTKRIHDAYGPNWRAEDPGAFGYLPGYLNFAETLAAAYERTGVLTYLNALLKCGDTLSSLSRRLGPDQLGWLADIFQRERSSVLGLNAHNWRGTAPSGPGAAPRPRDEPVVLEGVAMIACNSARSQAYLQALLAGGMRPKQVMILGEDAAPLAQSGDAQSWNGLVLPNLGEPIAETCRAAGIPVVCTPEADINSDDAARLVAESGARFLIYSGVGGQIVSERVLRLGPRFLHMHSGYLPEYRGSTTLYYALLNGDLPGVSAIFLDPGIDTGPIIERRHYPVPPAWMDVDRHYDAAIRADLLCRVMERHVMSGRIDVAEVQSSEVGRTYYVIHPVLKHVALLSLEKQRHD